MQSGHLARPPMMKFKVTKTSPAATTAPAMENHTCSLLAKP